MRRPFKTTPKEKAPLPFVSLGAFFIQFCRSPRAENPLGVALLLIGGTLFALQATQPKRDRRNLIFIIQICGIPKNARFQVIPNFC